MPLGAPECPYTLLWWKKNSCKDTLRNTVGNDKSHLSDIARYWNLQKEVYFVQWSFDTATSRDHIWMTCRTKKMDGCSERVYTLIIFERIFNFSRAFKLIATTWYSNDQKPCVCLLQNRSNHNYSDSYCYSQLYWALFLDVPTNKYGPWYRYCMKP